MMIEINENHNQYLLTLAFNLDETRISRLSHDTPRPKVKTIFDLTANERGVREVLFFMDSIKLETGIELFIHEMRPLCIEVDFAVKSPSELSALAKYCETEQFQDLVTRHKILTFDFVSDSSLPTFVFH